MENKLIKLTRDIELKLMVYVHTVRIFIKNDTDYIRVTFLTKGQKSSDEVQNIAIKEAKKKVLFNSKDVSRIKMSSIPFQEDDIYHVETLQIPDFGDE